MMKKLCILTALFSALLYCACHKDAAKADQPDHPINGKWTLTETLADPGDASGKWMPADKLGFYFVQFNADGGARSNTYTGLKRYELLNDSSIRFTYANGSMRG